MDAGIPWRRAQERMAVLGLRPSSYCGLLISHEHSDHSSHAGIFHRATGMPIAASQRTVDVIRHSVLGRVQEYQIRRFRSGTSWELGPFRVETYQLHHDAVDPVGFIVDNGQRRVGFITDLGRASRKIQAALGTLDAVFIESNFDRGLLEGNPRYPLSLKERIWGFRGHLENRYSAALVKTHASQRLRHVLLSHLSEDNNHPELALAAHRAEWDSDLPLFDIPQLLVAPRHEPSPLLEL